MVHHTHTWLCACVRVFRYKAEKLVGSKRVAGWPAGRLPSGNIWWRLGYSYVVEDDDQDRRGEGPRHLCKSNKTYVTHAPGQCLTDTRCVDCSPLSSAAEKLPLTSPSSSSTHAQYDGRRSFENRLLSCVRHRDRFGRADYR